MAHTHRTAATKFFGRFFDFGVYVHRRIGKINNKRLKMKNIQYFSNRICVQVHCLLSLVCGFFFESVWTFEMNTLSEMVVSL